jgi:hypothetical protein
MSVGRLGFKAALASARWISRRDRLGGLLRVWPSVLLACFLNDGKLHAQDGTEQSTPVAAAQTDATARLQRLIDDSSGDVRLPSGNFRITEPLTIDLTEQGYRAIRGSSATKIVMAGSGPAFRVLGSHFKSADPSGVSDTTWQAERFPTISDLAIEGAHPEADGIQAVGTFQLTLSRLHLRKLRHGVHLVENNRNVIIDACHIYENQGIGIYYDDVNLHQSNIIGCHISYCDGGGIVSRQGNVRNIHITGCDLESNMSADHEPTANVLIDCRGSDYGTAEVAITGCTIQHNDDGPESANIRIIGQSNPTDRLDRVREGNIAITGNVLSDVHTNVWLEECRGVTIVSNTLWMGFAHNLLIERSSHIVIGANNLDRNPRYNYGRSLEAENRVVFRECEACTVSGLHVSEVSREDQPERQGAVVMSDCRRMHVNGLTILDCDVGLELRNVTSSQFDSLMIDDSRDDSDSIQVLLDATSQENSIDSRVRSTPLQP